MRFLFVLLLLAAAPAFAQVPDDLAATYLEQSLIDAQATAIAEQLTAQIAAQASQFPEPAREPFLAIYGEAFSADAIEDRLETFLVEEGDADSLRAALDWEQQPLAVRMLALVDSSSNDPDGQVAIQMYAMSGNLGTREVTPEREAQMDRYLDITAADRQIVDLYLDIIVASSRSMQAIATEEPPPADSIRAELRPQLESQIGGMVRGGTLYAFRDVSDEDFDAYLDLLEEPAAQYAARINTEAMKTALVGAIADAGEAFAQRLLALDEAGEIDLDALREQQAETARGSDG